MYNLAHISNTAYTHTNTTYIVGSETLLSE